MFCIPSTERVPTFWARRTCYARNVLSSVTCCTKQLLLSQSSILFNIQSPRQLSLIMAWCLCGNTTFLEVTVEPGMPKMFCLLWHGVLKRVLLEMPISHVSAKFQSFSVWPLVHCRNKGKLPHMVWVLNIIVPQLKLQATGWKWGIFNKTRFNLLLYT